ncbi:MAG: SPASM domain-containing protein [Acidimicrobiales bacterium]|nr:SPASM domain-containing protein [Acidimicrobiales bacterium]
MQILRSRRSRRAVAPQPTGACGAPRSSMYFGPDGTVRACCVNTTYTLGKIGEQSIREVWEGARIAAMRDALDAHDYSLGCRDCEHRVAAGDRAWSTAPQYDEYLDDEPGEFPRRMDFILSITCNLQCAMCDGELSSSIRLHREKRPPLPPAYGDAFFDELREFLPHLDLAVFLGGEPFVAREPQRVFDLMIELGTAAEVRVVTNGTQWNPRVERYLRGLPVNVAVSIDGHSATTLESLRVGVDRDRLFANLGHYQEAVAGHEGTVSIHFCLMRQNWHEFADLLLEADRRDIHVIVMTVTGPAGFSLWDLPAPELREVLDGLERRGEQVADRLGRNREVWNDELARVRRHLAALEEGALPEWVTTSWGVDAGVPVELGPRPASSDVRAVASLVPGVATATGAQLEEELERWAGRQPLVLHLVGSTIGGVDEVGWAAPLDPGGWVGLDVKDLVARLGDIGRAHV